MSVADSPTTEHAATSPPAAVRPVQDESTRVVEIFETVLTALILALVFRAFFIEAFVIPTGSMAGGLLGKHLSWVCENCSWQYEIGPANYGDDSQFIPPVSADCPNCHSITDLRERSLSPRDGDRILVHKWPYPDLIPVRRWDVMVFRDPVDPTQNYIKRVVGLPGETVEIIDGDVYIGRPGKPGRVASKTDAAQEALWEIVYHQDFLPLERASLRPPTAWWAESDATGWSDLEARTLRFTPPAVAPPVTEAGRPVDWLRFDPEGSSDYLRDVIGYNYAVARNFVGDVRLLGDVTFAPGQDSGAVLFELERDGVRYVMQYGTDGRVRLDVLRPDGRDSYGPAVVRSRVGAPVGLELRYVDCRVQARVNGRVALSVTTDADPDHLEQRRAAVRVAPVEVRIGALGRASELRHFHIERDVYYTQSGKTLRARPGEPFVLEADEFFVLGDNSPSSHDSREWHRVGRHLSDPRRSPPYRVGTVPRDQIVGKAFFVYLPGLVSGERSAWRLLPDIGRMRFVR